MYFSEPLLDSRKGIRAYGDNAIYGGIGLIAVDRLQVVVKNQTAGSLNEDEASSNVPFILWANIDHAIDLPCGHYYLDHMQAKEAEKQ